MEKLKYWSYNFLLLSHREDYKELHGATTPHFIPYCKHGLHDLEEITCVLSIC